MDSIKLRRKPGWVHRDIPWTSRKHWIINYQSLLHFCPDFPFSPDFRNGGIQSTFLREINSAWNVPVLVCLLCQVNSRDKESSLFTGPYLLEFLGLFIRCRDISLKEEIPGTLLIGIGFALTQTCLLLTQTLNRLSS